MVAAWAINEMKTVDLRNTDWDEIERNWGYFDWKCQPDEVLGVLSRDLQEHGLAVELGIDGSDGYLFRIVKFRNVSGLQSAAL